MRITSIAFHFTILVNGTRKREKLNFCEIGSLRQMEQEEVDLIIQVAQRRALSKLMTEYYTQEIRQNPMSVTSDPRVIEAMNKLNFDNKDGRESEWVWITINPDPKHFENDEEEVLREFMSKVQKAIGKKWVIHASWVFEKYTKNGERVHVHILLRKPKNKRPSEVKREWFNTFKEWVGCEKHIRTYFLYEPEVIQQKLDYVNGMKKEEKMKNVKNDMKWRKKIGIEDVYKKVDYETKQ